MSRPLLLGHRGARSSRQIPENTLESFELCLQHGCDGFEFDVRRSVDGVAVVCHDPIVNGMEVSQTAARDLVLPRLEEVLRRFSQWAFLDIELKVPGLERRVVAFLRQAPPPRGYVVSSFLPEVLTAIGGFDATVPLGFICEKRDELEHWRELPVGWVMPSKDLVDEVLIESIHAADKKIMVWTVNNADDIRSLAKCGVDAIITDETEALGRAL
jgi:glycerophosphoryl diester phosphodiesterase